MCVCCIEVDLEAHLSGYQNQIWLWLNFWSGLLSFFLGSRFSRQKKQRTMMNDKITWKRLVHKVCRLCLSGDWSSLNEVDEAFVSCKVPATYLDSRRIRMYVSALWHVLPHHEQDKKQATKPHQITTLNNSLWLLLDWRAVSCCRLVINSSVCSMHVSLVRQLLPADLVLEG